MLRITLWIAAACAALLVVLAVSRGVRFTSDPQPAKAPSVEEAAEPAAAVAPEPQPTAPPPPTAEDLQVQEDAAAVGMTTMEPEPQPEPPPAQPPSVSPQN